MLRDTVRTAVRALDNVIDLNFYPLPYAELTNRRYRSIGLGCPATTTCWPSAASGGRAASIWPFADDVFERINRAAVEANADLCGGKRKLRLF